MKKQLVSLAVVCLCVFTVLMAQQVNVAPEQSMAVSVGRGRAVVESGRLPGQHNLVVITQRRLRPTCAEVYRLLSDMAELRQQRAGNPLEQISYGLTRGDHRYQELDQRYQAMVASDQCGYEVYRSETHNLVTNAGLLWLANIMADTSTPPTNAQCNYIALTATAITPAATDTTLSGEITTNGLARALGTYTYAGGGATTYTIAKTFTATGAQSAQAGGVFTASSSGTMCFEDTFTSASLQTNDTLTVTWTVTI